MAERNKELAISAKGIGNHHVGALDDRHNFFARMMGVCAIFYAGLLLQLDETTATRVFPWHTAFIATFYVCGPVYASGLVFTPAKGMSPPKSDFWHGGMLVTMLVLVYVYTLAAGGHNAKQAKA